ncbi:hypothetical protein A3715_17190 [Oleiphilus sp. HI0009]|nr:hypothetical protein A3715_17190 [Oleiphilus sp. HI0009]
MKKAKSYLAVISAVIAITLSGCSSIKLIQEQDPDYNKVTSYESVEDKAVVYIYRTNISDFKGMATTVDIGKEELEIFDQMLHRFEMPEGIYNMEPNGIGMFAIENELDIELLNGNVYFIELMHESRIAIPNKSSLLLKTKDELNEVMKLEKLRIAEIKVI